MNMRFAEMNVRKKREIRVSDFEKKSQYIEYPEEMTDNKISSNLQLSELLKDKELKEKFFDGVTYEKDPVETSDE